jgi:hypothetical protein
VTAAVHRCERGPHCRDAQTVTEADGTSSKQGAMCDRPLCDTCERQVARTLSEVPRLYVDLELIIGAGLTANADRPQVTGSKGRPLPVNAHALHLQETVHGLLCQWEDTVRHAAGLSPVTRRDRWDPTRRRSRAAVETAAAARLLAAHLTAWLVHGPIVWATTAGTADPDDPKAQPSDVPQLVEQDGVAAAVQLLDWKQQVRHAAGVTRLVTRRDEPCMYCEVRAIVVDNGADDVRCEACHRSWPRDEYLGKVRGFAPYLRRLGAAG